MTGSRKELLQKQRQLEAENVLYRAWLEALAHYANFDLWFKTGDSQYAFVNDKFARVMGRSRQDLLENQIEDMFDADRCQRIRAMDAKVMSEGYVQRNVPCGDGVRAEMHEEHRFVVKDKGGRAIGLGCFAFEVTDKSLAEETLVQAEKLARMGSWRWSARDNFLISCSEQLAELLKYSMSDLFSLWPNRIDVLVHPDDHHKLGSVRDRVKGISTGPYSLEYRLIRGDGQTIIVRESAEPFVQKNQPTEYVGVLQDVSRQKVAELQLKISNDQLEKRVEDRIKDLEYLAAHDPLTGLLNRKSFMDRVLNSKMQDKSDGHVLILFLDIQGLQTINEQYGYQIGDAILKETAQRISVMTNGLAYASRINGDDFVFALPPLDDPHKTAQALFKHIQRPFQNPIEVGNVKVQVRLIGGYSVGKCSETDLLKVIRMAEIALNKAKALPASRLESFFSKPDPNETDKLRTA